MVAGTLCASGLRSHTEIDGHGAHIPVQQPVPIQDGREMHKGQNGIGIGQQGDPAYTLDTTGAQAIAQPVPFTKAKRAQSATDDETWVEGAVSPTPSLFDQGDTRATTVAVAIQGTLIGRDAGGPQGVGASDCGEMFTLTKTDVHAVAFHPTQDPISSSESSHALGTGSKGGCATAAVAFTPGNLTRGAGPSPNAEVAPTMKCSAGRGADDQRTCVAMVGTDLYNGAITGDVAATMGTPGSSVNASGPTVMAFAQNQVGEIRTSNVSGTINTNSNASGRNTPMAAVAFPIDTQNMTEGHASGGLGFGQHGDPSFTVTKGHSHAVAHNDPSRSPQSSEVTQQVAAVHAASMTVRRLTPRECERLQAFPDDYTLIPWRRKPAAECPDGPRYKALGNSMACNCMAWIGERIAAVEARILRERTNKETR